MGFLVILARASIVYISAISILVRDYDEACDYYVKALGFELIEDTVLGPNKRWLLVAPPGGAETRLLLAKAEGAEQIAQIGKQSGGRVFLILNSDDFDRDYRNFTARGVRFCEIPRYESYGTVAVFEDLYGNRWDLIQHKSLPKQLG
jgi:catechol 2,3-dioxygenase-like lactoylglutathione lyase family enzyme